MSSAAPSRRPSYLLWQVVEGVHADRDARQQAAMARYDPPACIYKDSAVDECYQTEIGSLQTNDIQRT